MVERRWIAAARTQHAFMLRCLVPVVLCLLPLVAEESPPAQPTPLPEPALDPAVEPPTPVLEVVPLPRDVGEDRSAVRRLVVAAARALAEGDRTALAQLATPDAALPDATPGLALQLADEPRIDADHALAGGAALAEGRPGRWHAGAIYTMDGWRLTLLAVTIDQPAPPPDPVARPWGWLIAGGILGLALGAVLGLTLVRQRR
jgi:hypothetical protein